jgi:BRCT domain type II-containing protein
MSQHQKIEKKTTIVLNLKNVPINDKDLQNFMIESTNREREEVELQNARI